jgi:hypothetical protein
MNRGRVTIHPVWNATPAMTRQARLVPPIVEVVPARSISDLSLRVTEAERGFVSLAPTPPSTVNVRGKPVCNCVQVSYTGLEAATGRSSGEGQPYP